MKQMDTIYQEYAQTVYRYLMSLTHDSLLSEELTQETFFQAVRSSGRYDGSCRMSTWLCAIAKNVFYTYLRKNPPAQSLDEPGQADDPGAPSASSAEADALRSMERTALFRKLHELPDPWREVLYLRLFGDLSFREIGEILGKTENWARVTFYRGKEKLRKEIDENE